MDEKAMLKIFGQQDIEYRQTRLPNITLDDKKIIQPICVDNAIAGI